MKEELKNIKEQLFDAPVEVKKAFNQVVEYFDDKEIITVHKRSDGGYTIKVNGKIDKRFVTPAESIKEVEEWLKSRGLNPKDYKMGEDITLRK